METIDAGKREIDLSQIKGELKADFDRMPAEKIHDEWEMDLPEEIIDFCKLVESVGGQGLVGGRLCTRHDPFGDKRSR